MKKALLALAALLSACTATAPVETAPAPAPTNAAPTRAPAASVVEGGNEFGVDLYRRLAAQRGNVFVSPTSISTAFALAYAGARGATAEEIARTLHYPRAALHPEMGALLRTLATNAPGRRLTVANALWVQRGFALRPEYLSVTREHYGAAPETLDFARQEEAVGRINRWAEENTNGLIRGLLTPEQVDGDTRLVLTNTVYFLADWVRQFDREATREGDFHLAGGGTRRTPLMNQDSDFRYFETPDFQAAALPYRGDEFEMDVFLPRARDGLGAFEAALTPALLREWLRRLDAAEPRRLALALPKVRVQARYMLPQTLRELGMVTPFTEAADFSGIAQAPLAISQAVHQTYLRIDEQGTEAAAATAVAIMVTGARIRPPPVPFRADHPFFFLIRHRPTGAVVFLGRIEAPEAP
ncbi:MAG TPA: serpin family protein [Allosphingosinicella sp.]